MSDSIRRFLGLFLSLILICTMAIIPTAAADESEAETTPIKILAIGNSYSNNSTEYISAIADSMGLDITAASLYQAGCPLERHVKYYEAFETLGKDAYYASSNSNKYEYLCVDGVANRNILSIQEAIAYTDWDYITIQQMPDYCDDITSYWTEEKPYITKLYGYVLDELAANNNTKCEILIHQGWSFSHAMSIDNAYNYYPVDYENTNEFFKAIEATVNEAAELLKTKMGLDAAPELVLSGKAMQLAKDQFGFADSWGEATSLYNDSISHLSPVGRYLVGCVWIETFAAKAGLDNSDTRTATYIPADKGITEEMAVLLRSCAHEAVTGEADTVYGDWRAIPYEDGLKITHFVGEVPATGTVTVPALLGEKSVLCVGETTFKYVEGVTAVVTESNGVIVEDGAYDGLKIVPTFWDGTTVKPTVGTGQENDPYIITNAAHLHWAVTNTNTGVYFKLANDIYINDIVVNAASGTATGTETAKQWSGGYNPTIFKGIIDGDNHVVSGLYIDTAYTGTEADWKVGYGLIPGGACTVKNLGVVNAFVKAEKAAASAFIGTNFNNAPAISFENCFVGEDVYLSGSCVGGFWAGGTAAYSYSTDPGFKNCYCLATISSASANFWGALTGQVWSTTAEGKYVLAENCYTNTRLYGQAALKFSGCYSTGERATQSGVTTLTAENMQGANSASKMSALHKAFVVTDGYPALRTFTSRTNGEWSGFRSSAMGGDGTEESPWLIATPENLAHIAFGGTSAGKYYKLTTDVYLNDINKIDFSTGVVEEGYDAIAWENDAAFNGSFDGNGHVVYGMWYPVGNAAGSTTIVAAGLFGNPKANSEIKNVGVRYAYLESVGQVGAIAGFIESVGTANILIDSCFSDNTVTVNSKRSEKIINDVTSSGILGGVINSKNITISNCYSFANVKSENAKKKILASVWQNPVTGNENVRIENCYADGEICGGSGASNKVNAVINSYCTAAGNANYLTWTQIAASAMKGAKALDRMPELGDKFIAQVKDYPTLKVFAPDAVAPDTSFWDGAYVAPTKGSGSETDPYLISTPEEFAYIIYNGGTAGAYYKLTADIYLNKLDKVDWTNGQLLDEGYPVNEWFAGVTTGGNSYYNGINNITFSGIIDGDGHAVYGLYYAPGQPGTCVGLIPAVKKATIKNLALKVSFVAGGRWTGALVGATNASGDVLTVDKVIVDESVTVWAYNSGNYYYDGITKSDRINAASPYTGAVSGEVRFESHAAGGIIGYVATSSTANITDTAVYAKLDGTSCKTEYSNPYANGGKAYTVGICGTLYGLMGTCWNPKALNFDNCITTTNPVNNGNAALGTPNFTMFNIYNAGAASTRDGVNNVTAALLAGENGLSEAPELSKDVWYSVKAEGKYPALRVIGTEIGDVDENGVFTVVGDSDALRTVIIKDTVPSNGDTDKNGTVDICDLVALQNK